MMAKDPARRYQEPRDIVAALGPFFKRGLVSTDRADIGQLQLVEGSIAPATAVPKSTTVQTVPATPLRVVVPPATLETPGGTSPLLPPFKAAEYRTTRRRMSPRGPRRRSLVPWVVGLLLLVSVAGLTVAVWLAMPSKSGRELFVDEGDSAFGGGAAAEIDWDQERAKLNSKQAQATLPDTRPVPDDNMLNPVVLSRPVATTTDSVNTSGASLMDGNRDVPLQVAAPLNRGDESSEIKPAIAEIANDVSQATAPATTAVSTATDSFIPLFNGRDLSGWRVLPRSSTAWKVENDILCGPTGETSYLLSDGDHYRNFDLLVEARINFDGNSGVCFRVASFDGGAIEKQGYEAQIGTHPPTGSLMNFGPAYLNHQHKVRSGSWFTLEIITDGPLIMIKLDGEKTVEMVDNDQMFNHGHLALLSQGAKTVVEFRKIEIRELPSSVGAP